VAVNIRERFLKDAKKCSLDFGREPLTFFGEMKSGNNTAALCEVFDVPASGRDETGFVQQWRMQEVRQRPSVGNSMLDELLRFAK
jgi:hypothetical protein